MASRRYRVGGMDCAEETEALRQTVGRLPGVAGIDFNLLNGTMEVVLSDETLGDVDIIAAAKRAGLDAVPQGAVSGAAEPLAGDDGVWRRNGRALLCWASGVLILAGLPRTRFCMAIFFMRCLAREARPTAIRCLPFFCLRPHPWRGAGSLRRRLGRRPGGSGRT